MQTEYRLSNAPIFNYCRYKEKILKCSTMSWVTATQWKVEQVKVTQTNGLNARTF